MPQPLSSRQRQTLAAREAFDRKYDDPEQRSAHFRELAAKSHASRLVLSADEARALSECYALLRKIAQRVGADGAADNV